MNIRNLKVAKPLRVLMFVPKYPLPVVGGLEKQAFELSNKLKHQFGVEVHVLSTRFDASHMTHDLLDGIAVTRVGWSDSRWFRFTLLPFQVALVIWRARKVTDVVHVHQHSPFGLFVIAFCRMLLLPVIVKLPNVGDHGILGLKRGLFGRLANRVLLSASAFVSMSDVSINELLKEGIPRSRILTIPNGIVPSQSSTPIAQSQIVKATYPCRVVFVGRIYPQKRIDVLLQAWHSIADQVREIAVLEIWGDGPQREALVQWCRDRDLNELVKWRGHIVDVRTQLTNVDIFVLPSSSEGNSNAILEAMDAGLPVVATPVGGTVMQLGPPGESYIVEVGNSDILAEKLLLLIKNPILSHNYGKELRDRVQDYFDIQNIASGYLCAYKKLVLSKDFDLSDCASLPDSQFFEII